MSGKQRKFRVKTSGGDEEDAAAPPQPKPSSAVAKPSLLSFDEDSGDDGPSIAPKKKSISIDKDKKPKLGRAPPLTVPESVPVVGTTQRSSVGESHHEESMHMGLGRHG